MTDEVDRSDIDASKAPLLDHLIELRGRLLRCVVLPGASLLALATLSPQLACLELQTVQGVLPAVVLALRRGCPPALGEP
jgi:Sec-independent protein secretion pathway component TatC